jgi:hypothetical protein
VNEGVTAGKALLDAMREAEAEIHRLYERHAERPYAESIRTALIRHRREEEAHLSFLNESDLWRDYVDDDDEAPEPTSAEAPAEGRQRSRDERTDARSAGNPEDQRKDDRLAD